MQRELFSNIFEYFIQCYSYNWPFEGRHDAGVALGENECDGPDLAPPKARQIIKMY